MTELNDFEGPWAISVDSDYDGPEGLDDELGLPKNCVVPISLRREMGALAGTTPSGMRMVLDLLTDTHAIGRVERQADNRRFFGVAHLILSETEEEDEPCFIGTVTIHDGRADDSPGAIHIVLSKPYIAY